MASKLTYSAAQKLVEAIYTGRFPTSLSYSEFLLLKQFLTEAGAACILHELSDAFSSCILLTLDPWLDARCGIDLSWSSTVPILQLCMKELRQLLSFGAIMQTHSRVRLSRHIWRSTYSREHNRSSNFETPPNAAHLLQLSSTVMPCRYPLHFHSCHFPA
ncbi:hypothetical protein Pelo_12386 [Pelomyxa schiedti]|nr:hypothetical protein Pelo_12386 [Pelomyxa schiedti]